MKIDGNIVDIINERIDYGAVVVDAGQITKVVRIGEVRDSAPYVLPGFIDAHVHIESSMLVPTEFARLAVRHGTVATVSDPHEIANVLGIAGVEYMLENARQSPLKFHFGAPSCVPATGFETAGATIDSDGILQLLSRPDIWYLAEMMNYPGVLMGDPVVFAKIRHAQDIGKPVDGHAPGLTGDNALKYIEAGIQTDHECVTYAEALFKLQHGMKIIIREGSAAKNFEALCPLIGQHPSMVMLGSDDKHPDDLVEGHINALVRRAVRKGCSVFHALRTACLNPVAHYNLPVGTLHTGDPADFVVVRDLQSFEVLSTIIDGAMIYHDGTVRAASNPIVIHNYFKTGRKTEADFALKMGKSEVRVIKAIDGSLLTAEMHVRPSEIPNPGKDILKIAVVNRYSEKPPAVALIHGFGLKHGAIASSVAHDSHNIVAVGTTDDALTRAVNAVIEARGGIAAVDGEQAHVLPLPVAGLMSDRSGDVVAREYTRIDQFVKEELESTLTAPFMTLSFMALLVIPQLKLSDLGLFDGETFQFVPLEFTG